ncbi:MAG: glycogen synthase GlgA [Candidatus Zhuqueibacterota bacterium]
MQKKLKILYISSEIAPFAKTGGLADVAGALPKILKENEHDIRLFMPKYASINERKFTLREVIRLKDIIVPLGNKTAAANVKSAFLPDSKVQVYFIENKEYFNRPDFYIDPETNKDWPDNAERFIFFSRAALEILKILHWQPDIIHCNDWQSALIPLYLKTIFKDDPFFAETHSLLSIHNIAFQGVFEPEILPLMGVPDDLYYKESPIEFWGKINFLKGGIVYADVINTVSKNYAKEIQSTDEFGRGLQFELRKRNIDLYGIVNGIDYSVWDPEIDTLIAANYSRRDLTGKAANKKFLVESLGLNYDENAAVIGTVSRLTDQKGFDLIAEALDEMLKMNVQYILLGTGDEMYHKLFEKFAQKYPKKISVNLKFDNQLAHQIEAGCDMFLMPSQFEPCGLNQLYSLKYGTIPIVRATGGLVDTVKKIDSDLKRGWGFVFTDYSSRAMLDEVRRAVESFKDKENWRMLMSRAMKLDFSWRMATEKYERLYEKLVP